MSLLHVIFKVGDSEYAVAASEVFQLENYSEVTAVPGSASYVAGLIQVRQQIIPVIDMHLRFGLPATSVTSESRVIILKLGSRLVGLIVDSARDIKNFEENQFHQPPEIISTQSHGFVKSIAQFKNRIIMLLDSEKVVGEGVLNA